MANLQISGRSCTDWLDDGPLAPYVDALKQYLTERGYARNSFANCVGSLSCRSRSRQADVRGINLPLKS